jgi:hypothetical protein
MALVENENGGDVAKTQYKTVRQLPFHFMILHYTISSKLMNINPFYTIFVFVALTLENPIFSFSPHCHKLSVCL